MKKLITLLVSLTMISCASAFSAYAGEIEVPDLPKAEREALKEIAKKFGSETEYLTYVNYSTLPIADMKANKSYAEFLKRCNNAQTALDPSASYNATLQGGRCMGISLIEILSHNGYFTPSDIHEGATYLTDIELDDEAKYFTDFYSSVQLYTEFDLYLRWNLSHYSNEERVKMLLDTAEKATEEGKYFLIVLDASNFSHAVTGIGVVDGDWTIDDKHYDKCVLTYDSNTVNANYLPQKMVCWGFTPETSLFINTETNEICIPAYCNYVKSPLNVFSTDDDSLMRYKGLLNPTDSIDTDVSEITAIDVSGNSTYSITGTRADGSSYNCSADSYKNYPTKKGKAYYLDGKNFTVENTSGTDLDVTFTDTAHTIICNTNGSVDSIYKDDYEVRVLGGENEFDYDISVIFNERNYKFTPHYRWNFKGGNSNQVSVSQADNGIVLSGNNGVKCSLSIYDSIFDEDMHDAEYNTDINIFSSNDVMISCNESSNDLVFSIGENFDIPVKSGDVNCDGRIDACDASYILSDYANASTDKKTILNKQLADYNNDGKVDAIDASAVLSEYARLSTS